METEIEKLKEQFQIQTEILELVIKAGRRMMHDYQHMVNEIPSSNIFKKDYELRGDFWKNIFYPDEGPKNYRANIYREVDDLEFRLNRAINLLKENKIDTTGIEY